MDIVTCKANKDPSSDPHLSRGQKLVHYSLRLLQQGSQGVLHVHPHGAAGLCALAQPELIRFMCSQQHSDLLPA